MLFQAEVALASIFLPNSYFPFSAWFIHWSWYRLFTITFPFVSNTTLSVVLKALKYTPPFVEFVLFIVEFTFILFACNFNCLSVLQVIFWFTVILLVACKCTFVVSKLFWIAVALTLFPVRSFPPVDSINIFVGSSNQSFAITFVFEVTFNFSPLVSTKPPLAIMLPSTFVVPPWAKSITSLCVNSSKEFASIIPLWFTTPLSNSSFAFVVRYICPPFATIRFWLSTRASSTPLFTFKDRFWFSFKVNVTSEAPIKFIVPLCTSIFPLFVTLFAINVAWVFARDFISPSFTILSFELPLKLYFPLLKSSFEISFVEATIPAVFTFAFLPNKTPFEFISHTCPFAFNAPSIIDFSFPITLFKVIEFTFGWLKFTVSFDLIEKSCQFIMALFELWFIFVVFAFWEIVAFPLTTVPPVGAPYRFEATTSEITEYFTVQNRFL